MDNIYQRVWDADQSGNGIQPILKGQKGDETTGYVVVDEGQTRNRNHKLFPKVVIPKHKKNTYDLCRKLFNNYRLNKNRYEHTSMEESQEVHDFLEAIIDTKPMKVVRNYLSAQTGESYSSARWYTILKIIYFTPFRMGSGPAYTGFEHLVVGEQKDDFVSGYHFWYKFYLDDSVNYLQKDDIQYMGTRSDRDDLAVPETSTIAFKWEAMDYDTGKRVPLIKKAGGFFNGCSIEGLLALGAIRFSQKARAPKEAIINGAKYNLVIYRKGNHMITYYPEFVRIVDRSQIGKVLPKKKAAPTKKTPKKTTAVRKVPELSIRIIAAMVNPIGSDRGKETITLLNTNPEAVNLKDWRVEGENERGCDLDVIVPAGATTVIKLTRGSMSMTNTGGVINLEDHEGTLIDTVSYSRSDASHEGWTIVF